MQQNHHNKQQKTTLKWPYSNTSTHFKETIQLALKCKNAHYSCNLTAKQLKQCYEKVNQQRLKSKQLQYNKKEFQPVKCSDSIWKQVGLQNELQKAQMFRFPLHDLQHDYDHYVTIFKQTIVCDQNSDKKQKEDIWFLVHSWENVYSLKNWVYDVDIEAISKAMCEQQFDPISHLIDFLGYFNEKWFYQFYKDKQHEKHEIFPRFPQIFSFNSNDHRRIREVEWYTPLQ